MDFKRVVKLARFIMVYILDDIKGSNPAVADKNNYIKCIVRCSSNICKQETGGGLGCYLIFS